MKMFATSDKAKPTTENIRGLTYPYRETDNKMAILISAIPSAIKEF
jgi:hypothetical protein